ASPAAPSRPGIFGGLMGGLAGFALGGLLGSMLFGHGFGGGFGGIGMLEILLIGGAIAVIVMMLRRRRTGEPSYATAYRARNAEYAGMGMGGNGGASTSSCAAPSTPSAVPDVSPASADLARGLSHIRQMDPVFDELQFTATATAVFMRIQGAWPTGNLDAV